MCSPSSVNAGATSQCTASVTGTGSYSTAVNWSASAGTITANGAFTAPVSAGTVTIPAISSPDPVVAGAAPVPVQQPAPPGSTITSVKAACSPTTLNAGATAQCAATVTGTGRYSSAVTWTASSGAITAAGLFTAPPAAGSATITATSTQDPTKSGTATVAVQSAPRSTPHIVMVMEENTGYTSVVRNTSSWPNLNNLIANGALPTRYYANTHPSIGNYFMLTTGQVLTNDDNSTHVWNVDSIARRLLAAKIPFRIYAEDITRGYVGGNTGLYVIRHNPFAMLSDIANNPQVANQCIWPFSQFAADLANGNLPAFSFIVPNIADDAHSGPALVADLWLQKNVVLPLSNNPAFTPGGNGLLIVEFDEAATSDTSYGGGHVSPVFWGPLAKTGYTQTSTTIYQHQSMLRTIMNLLSLPNPPGVAANAPAMSEFLTR